MNILISKELHTTMSRLFYSDAKQPKMCCSSSSSSSHFLFPRDFSETIADRDIINTPLEPLLVDVPFEGYKTETKDLGGIFVAV